jgi:hypothetical protein
MRFQPSLRPKRAWFAPSNSDINNPASIRTPKEHFMIRHIAFALALTFAASIFVQVIAVSQAEAGKTCTYTSSDKKKGYKC